MGKIGQKIANVEKYEEWRERERYKHRKEWGREREGDRVGERERKKHRQEWGREREGDRVGERERKKHRQEWGIERKTGWERER